MRATRSTRPTCWGEASKWSRCSARERAPKFAMVLEVWQIAQGATPRACLPSLTPHAWSSPLPVPAAAPPPGLPSGGRGHFALPAPLQWRPHERLVLAVASPREPRRRGGRG